jgi:hypothetical protein
MDFASHPREGRLGEVCQARIALLVTCQHPERHQTVQPGPGSVTAGHNPSLMITISAALWALIYLATRW